MKKCEHVCAQIWTYNIAGLEGGLPSISGNRVPPWVFLGVTVFLLWSAFHASASPLPKALRNVIWASDLLKTTQHGKTQFVKQLVYFTCMLFFVLPVLSPSLFLASLEVRSTTWKMFHLSRSTQAFRCSCALSHAVTFIFIFLGNMPRGLHNARVRCWDFSWRMKRFNKLIWVWDTIEWHLIVISATDEKPQRKDKRIQKVQID